MPQIESMDETVERLLVIVRGRMKELEPQVGEARWLQEQLVIVNYAIQMRADLIEIIKRLERPAATKKNVNKWAEALELDVIVRAGDLAAEFSKYDSWARNHLNRLVDAGVLEKWGKGQYRRKPDRAGTAKIHLVTKGAA
jgi:hypothetical protein